MQISLSIRRRAIPLLSSDGSRPKDCERAVVFEAEVHKEQGGPLFGVNGEVRSKNV
jgi:hypothetical protein